MGESPCGVPCVHSYSYPNFYVTLHTSTLWHSTFRSMRRSSPRSTRPGPDLVKLVEALLQEVSHRVFPEDRLDDLLDHQAADFLGIVVRAGRRR